MQRAYGAYLRPHSCHRPSPPLVEDRRPSCVGGLRLWLRAGEMLWGAAAPPPGRGAAVAAPPPLAPAPPSQSLRNDVPHHLGACLPGQGLWDSTSTETSRMSQRVDHGRRTRQKVDRRHGRSIGNMAGAPVRSSPEMYERIPPR